MSVAKARISVSAILVATVLLCQTAVASLGLGEARVQSFLGQNLEVRIALLQSGEAELDALEVAVASADDHARLGVPSEALALGLSATLDLAADPPVIRLRSRRPVTEPFVQVLLNARWASGRLLREYTLFFDPPAVPVAPLVRRVEAQPPAQEQPAQEQPAQEQPAQERPAPERPAQERPAQERPAQEQPAQMPDLSTPTVEDVEPAPQPEVAPQSSADRQPPAQLDEPPPGVVLVERGQTLWSIATEWRPDSNLTMNQAMLAILESNPDAFMDNNVNRLRRGARLILPEVDDARAISASEAARRIREQAEAWEAGRAGLAANVMDPVELAPEPIEPEPETAGLESVGLEPEPATAELEAADLESESAASEIAQDPALPESDLVEPEPEAMAEPLSQPRLELAPPDEDLVAQAEAIEVERERLSGQLAELESEMALNGLQSLEGDVLVDQIRQAIDSGDAGGLMVASEDLARLEEQLRDARAARRAEQVAAQAAAARVETPAAAPASFLERWMWPLVGAAVGLVLLAMLIVLLRRRAARHDEDRLIEERGDREPPTGSEPTFSDTSFDEPESESKSSGSGQPEDDQDAQAAALMGILSRDDEDEEAYETAGAETEKDPEAWDRYDVEDGEPDLARLSDRLDPEELDEQRSPDSVPDMLALEDEDDDEDIETLFEPGETSARRPENMEEADAGPLTLDFEQSEQDPDAATQGDFSATERLEEDSAFDVPSSAAEEDWFAVEEDEDRSNAAQAVEPDNTDVETAEDSSGSAEGIAALGDEDAEVKLDLARAYISMEDPDSARTLLDEVLSDGSPVHREQAQKLLDSLK